MSDDVAEFFAQWKTDTARMRERCPDIMTGFGGLFRQLMKDGALGVREKELIALGIAVATSCTPCIRLHVEKCLASGATPEQVLEAAGVAVVMGGGPAYTHVAEVLHALETVQAESS